MDLFYNTKKLTLTSKRKLLLEAKSLCYKWWADVLTEDSWVRHKIDLPFDIVMKQLSGECHYIFIHRNDKYKLYDDDRKEYLETGFCTLGKTPEYFLWILLDIKHIKPLIKKYGLKPLKS